VARLPGVPLFIVANQSETAAAGAAVNPRSVEDVFAQIQAHLGGRITAARCCPHLAEAGCPGHKPAPGLLLDLAASYHVDLTRAWYVGDGLEDRECARRAGIGRFYWAQSFFAPAAPWMRNEEQGMRNEAGPSLSSFLIPHPSSLAVRLAAEADLPEIVGIYNEAIAERIATCDLEPVTVEARRPWFDRFDARHRLHVALNGERVVGWSAFLPYDPKPGYAGLVEHSVYVAREARGRGLGRQLLAHVIETATALGHRALLGRIFRHNEASLELHRRLGFTEAGVLPRAAILDGRFADVVFVMRELS
jgi:phosphinothricin acetyltransferase